MVNEMWILSIFLTAIAIAVSVAYKIEAARIPKKRERFRQRESLSLDEIYTQYFSISGIQKSRFENLWLRLANLLCLDPTKLRPTDRFDSEMAPVEGHLTEDELADVEAFFLEEIRKSEASIHHVMPETIEDFIMLLAKHPD